MPEWIAVIAAVAAFVVSVLILLEIRKSADAARKSAEAAEKSAHVAQQTAALMSHHFEEQAGLGAFTVSSAIDSAIAAIDPIVQAEGLRTPKAPASISCLIDLLDHKAESAINHAARINPDVAKQLSSAFELVRSALTDAEALLSLISRNVSRGHSGYQLAANRVQRSLEIALDKLLAAKHDLTGDRKRGTTAS